MQFFGGMSLDQLIDKDVDVCIRTSEPTGEMVELCRTFERDGQVWVDLIPKLNRKYVMPLPDDAIVSRNEADLSYGRYGVFISPASKQGQFVKSLIDAKKSLGK